MSSAMKGIVWDIYEASLLLAMEHKLPHKWQSSKNILLMAPRDCSSTKYIVSADRLEASESVDTFWLYPYSN